MVFVVNLLLAVVLTQTVSFEENSCERENRERGRNVRHLTEYVEELEGVEGNGDLGVSRADQYTSDDEKAAKDQIVLNRIREAFLAYRDRQSLEAKRKVEDEARKETSQKLGYHESLPTDLEENRSPPTSNLKNAIERQKREEPHIVNLIERHTRQKRREPVKRSESIDSVNVHKMIQFAQSATKAGFDKRNGDACFFERPAGAENYRVTSAAFYVYIHGFKRRPVQHNSVLLYRVAPSATYQMDKSQVEEKDKEFLATETISGSGDVSAWHRFDVTTMVQNWMSVGMADVDWTGLTVEFSDFDHEVVYPRDTGDQEHLPYLEMNVERKLNSRRRRSVFSSDSEMEEEEDADYQADGSSPSTAEEECNEEMVHCCRRSMKVDFQSVGLRWMISPKSFHLSYCDGQCSTTPSDTRLMSPGLAAAIADRKTAGLCCAPVEYADMDVVYYDDRMHVVFGTLRNFNVVRCGCL